MYYLNCPEFRESIARGKIEADARVAEALYHRGCGYSHPAVKIFMPAGAAAPVCVPYVKHYPPTPKRRWPGCRDASLICGGSASRST